MGSGKASNCAGNAVLFNLTRNSLCTGYLGVHLDEMRALEVAVLLYKCALLSPPASWLCSVTLHKQFPGMGEGGEGAWFETLTELENSNVTVL